MTGTDLRDFVLLLDLDLLPLVLDLDFCFWIFAPVFPLEPLCKCERSCIFRQISNHFDGLMRIRRI